MKTIALLSLSGLVAASQASKPQMDVLWSAPQATGVVDAVNLLPPPPSAPTAAPFFKPREVPALFRRVGEDYTCGLYSNGVPYECATTETCSSSGSNFGCCVGLSCAFSTACLDSTAEACSASTQGLQTLCCNFFSTQPYCVTIISTDGDASYTDFRCGNIQYATEIQTITALSVLSTEQRTRPTTTADTSEAPGENTQEPDGNTSTRTRSAPGSGNTDTSSDNNNDGNGNGDGNNNGDNDSGSNAGAIAGGVVGGIAAIGIIGMAFWFLNKRRNEKQPKPTGGAGTPGTTSYQAVHPGQGHPHPDMSQPYAGAGPGTPQPYGGPGTPGPFGPAGPGPYGQQHQGFTPYNQSVSPAGYSSTIGGPSPQTAFSSPAHPGHAAFYGQDPNKQPQFIAEVDGAGKQPAELA